MHPEAAVTGLLCAGGGFLLAVLWFDLMFDVQVLVDNPSVAALGSIAAYYRRVTTEASPMNYLVAAVMITTLAAGLVDLSRSRDRRGLRAVALLLAAAPIGLALVRVVPNAMILGAETIDDAAQVALARSILRDHLFCFGSIAAFLTLRLRLAAGERT
jgi:hypothetical protein